MTSPILLDRLATRAVLAASLGVLAQFGIGTAEASWVREQQYCMALTMYWEARGEGRDGMIAVGWTILNRVRSPRFPETPCHVAFQGRERGPCEFSYWCDGRSDRPRDMRSWRLALGLAEQLLMAPPPDPTGGALYYHATSIRRPWSYARTTRIGRHVFYR